MEDEMSDNKEPKKKAIIKNGKSPLALQKLVSALISDVTWEAEIISVGKGATVKIVDERWEIFSIHLNKRGRNLETFEQHKKVFIKASLFSKSDRSQTSGT